MRDSCRMNVNCLFLVQTRIKKKNGKHVTFRMAADGNEWVWVMGEESDTPTRNPHDRFNTK